VQYFIIIKSSDNVEHAVYGLDVREEGVAESFSLRSTLDEPSNIGDLQISRVHGWRFPKIAEEVLNAESDFPFLTESTRKLTYLASGTAHLASFGSIVQNG
jgi:hypothetical protein